MSATYLFRDFGDSLGGIIGHKAIDMEEIEKRITKIGDVSYTTKSEEDGFMVSMVFRSFYIKPDSQCLVEA